MFPVWKAISASVFFRIYNIIIQNVCKFRAYICFKFKSCESYYVREKILCFVL